MENKQIKTCEWDNCRQESTGKIPRDGGEINVCVIHADRFWKNYYLLGNEMLGKHGD